MESIKKHRGFLIFESVIFILLGVLAIIIPGLFTLSTELVIGAVIVAAGLVQAWRTFSVHGAWEVVSSILSALLYIVVGVLLLGFPVVGILSLTMLLAILFVLQGLIELYWGFFLRGTKRSGWWIVGGVISLVLAGMVFAQWPSSAVWLIGLLVGVNLLFYGFTMLTVALDE